MIKLCLFCNYFEFHGPTTGYSEYTPPGGMAAFCGYDHWDMGDKSGNTEFDLRRAMLTAETCPDYELSESALEIIEQQEVQDYDREAFQDSLDQ